MGLKAIFHPLTAKALLLLAALAAAAVLGSALVAQYGFGLYPCELCMAQRYPYMAIIALGAVFYFAGPPRVKYAIAILCGLLFLTDSGIAFYHTGVEYGWFPAPSACSNPASAGGESLEEMRRQIMNAPLVACNQAMAHILGLSLAAWNALVAFVLALMMACALKKIRRG